MKIFKSLIVVPLAVVSINAFGGAQQPAPVQIFETDGFHSASGDLWTARSDENDDVFIGCGVKHFSGDFSFGFCQAGDGNGRTIVCFTEDTQLLEAIYAINDSSYIRFTLADYTEYPEVDGVVSGEGECSRIDVSSQSFYLPLTTTKGTN